MPILYVLVVLIVLGFLVYLAETYIPMSPPFKMALRVVVILMLAIWILQLVGLVGPMVPRVR